MLCLWTIVFIPDDASAFTHSVTVGGNAFIGNAILLYQHVGESIQEQKSLALNTAESQRTKSTQPKT
eukprot:4469966-Ditylum_brightwellii.AAC.1